MKNRDWVYKKAKINRDWVQNPHFNDRITQNRNDDDVSSRFVFAVGRETRAVFDGDVVLAEVLFCGPIRFHDVGEVRVVDVSQYEGFDAFQHGEERE